MSELAAASATHGPTRPSSTTSRTSSSSRRRPRSGCGSSSPRRCSSSAGSSPPTRSTGTMYPAAFSAGSHHLSWRIGFANTLVLIGSSFTMALAVHSAAIGRKRRVVGFLLATILLGCVFLGVKYFEYGEKIRPASATATTPAASCPGERLRPLDRPPRGRRGRAGPDLLLALLRHDRAARAAHDHRDPDHPDDRLPGVAGPLPPRVPHARWSSSGSTGTSSTSSGSSSSPSST